MSLVVTLNPYTMAKDKSWDLAIGNRVFNLDGVINPIKNFFAPLLGRKSALQSYVNSKTHAGLTGAEIEANEFSHNEAELAWQRSEQSAENQRAWETEQSNTLYQRGVQDMQAAGLNIAAMYGGINPASTPNGASGGAPAASSVSPNTATDLNDLFSLMMAYSKNEAEIGMLNAQARNLDVNSNRTEILTPAEYQELVTRSGKNEQEVKKMAQDISESIQNIAESRSRQLLNNADFRLRVEQTLNEYVRRGVLKSEQIRNIGEFNFLQVQTAMKNMEMEYYPKVVKSVIDLNVANTTEAYDRANLEIAQRVFQVQKNKEQFPRLYAEYQRLENELKEIQNDTAKSEKEKQEAQAAAIAKYRNTELYQFCVAFGVTPASMVTSTGVSAGGIGGLLRGILE